MHPGEVVFLLVDIFWGTASVPLHMDYVHLFPTRLCTLYPASHTSNVAHGLWFFGFNKKETSASLLKGAENLEPGLGTP